MVPPLSLPPSPSAASAKSGPTGFDVDRRDLMVPVSERVCRNPAKIRKVPVDHKTFTTETNVAISNRSCAAKDADRRNPITPVVGSCQIIQAFAVGPAFRPALIVRFFIHADAVAYVLLAGILTRVLIGISILIGIRRVAVAAIAITILGI